MISNLHKNEVVLVGGAGNCICEGKTTRYSWGLMCCPKPAERATLEKNVPTAQMCHNDCCFEAWLSDGSASCEGYPYYKAIDYVFEGKKYDC